jgi:TolB-like protein
MRKHRGRVRVSFAIVLMSIAAATWSCSWGVHLWPERYDWVTGEQTAPTAVKAA